MLAWFNHEMESPVIIYRTNEAEFEIPADWHDRTANVFAVGNKLPLSLSVVITRDELKQGLDLASFADEKLEDLDAQLKQFELIEKRQLEVSGTIALESEFKWRSDKGIMHQRQIYVQYKNRVLIFTITAPRILTEEQRAQIDAVLSSLTLRD